MNEFIFTKSTVSVLKTDTIIVNVSDKSVTQLEWLRGIKSLHSDFVV